MKKWLVGVGIISVLALAACGGGEKETASSGNSVDAEKIVQQSCAGCHGGSLEGAVGPALDKIGSTLSQEEILDIINNGKNGGKMPGGLIKDDEAEAVAKWLAEKK